MPRTRMLFTLVGLLGVGTAALAQERRGDAQDPPRPPAAQTEKVGADREAAIAHALCMAIEGSELWACAHSASAGPEAATSNDIKPALVSHARASFEAGAALFASVNAEKKGRADTADTAARHTACERFFHAAWKYSQALQACCNQKPADRVDEREKPFDPARMMLLNHAVKEAVGAVGLRKMIQFHKDRSETAQALASHAEEMMRSSREALSQAGVSVTTSRSAAKPVAGDSLELPSREPAREPIAGDQKGPTTEDLGALARAVVDAAEQLDREGAAGAPRTEPARAKDR